MNERVRGLPAQKIRVTPLRRLAASSFIYAVYSRKEPSIIAMGENVQYVNRLTTARLEYSIH